MLLSVDDGRVASAGQQGRRNGGGGFVIQHCAVDHHRLPHPLTQPPKLDSHPVDQGQFGARQNHVDTDHAVMAWRQDALQTQLACGSQNFAGDIIADLPPFVQNTVHGRTAHPGQSGHILQSCTTPVCVFVHFSRCLCCKAVATESRLIVFNQNSAARTCQDAINLPARTGHANAASPWEWAARE